MRSGGGASAGAGEGGRTGGVHAPAEAGKSIETVGALSFDEFVGRPAGDGGLDHPLCDHARAVMLVELAGAGVRLADGATARLEAAKDAGRS